MKKVGIFLFTQDLRVHDNQALFEASQNVDELICIYLLDLRYRQLYKNGTSQSKSLWGINESQAYGDSKQHFTYQCIADLQETLNNLQQRLVILSTQIDQQSQVLFDFVKSTNASVVYKSNQPGNYEQSNWISLKNLLKSENLNTQCVEISTYSLFDKTDLPFDIKNLPDSFSKFRHSVEKLAITKPLRTLEWLPPMPNQPIESLELIKPTLNKISLLKVSGGESAALKHLYRYFSEDNGNSPAQEYKQTRNALDDWNSSTKFSFWLSNGCLSVKTIYSHLCQYESDFISNDSTYWIYFELLWREYFYWYAYKWNSKLFKFGGLKDKKPLTSFYPERFHKWCNGQTPYPIINACMKQLNDNGYISNRGRQLVASCFVHELQLDWRYGAAFFERHLIDYDVGSNWGNWQYLAGVGADPRGHRRFDLKKQTDMYDPDQTFINKWGGNLHCKALDSVDLVDWPTQ